MSVNERLREFLTQGKDWERKPTNIPGVFLLRLPGLRRVLTLHWPLRSIQSIVLVRQQKKEE